MCKRERERGEREREGESEQMSWRMNEVKSGRGEGRAVTSALLDSRPGTSGVRQFVNKHVTGGVCEHGLGWA